MKNEERSELTREKILQAALHEFGEHGYEGGTIGHICKTGINKGLIYHHFKSKDDLYLTCMRYAVNHLLLEVGDLDLQGQNIQDVISTYMNKRYVFFKTYHDEARIVFEGLLSVPTKLTSEVQEIFAPLHDLNEKLYQALLNSITLKENVNKEAALSYFSMVQSMFNAYFSSPMMRQVMVKVVNEDLEPYLPNIKCPTLLVWGVNDTATPLSDGEKMEKLIPDAGLVKLENAGHYSFLEQQFIFNRVMCSFMKIDN